MIKVGKQIVTIKSDERYLAFPALACLDNGDILMAFRSGRNCYRDFPEVLVNGTGHPHTDWCSEPWLARSTDGGRTWNIEEPPRSKAELEQDHARGIGYQDVGLTKLPDGRVMLVVFRWQYDNNPPPAGLATSVRENPPTLYEPFRYAYRLTPVYTICDPAGKTWTPFKPIDVRVPGTGEQWGLATRNGGVLLDQDTVGWPFYCDEAGPGPQAKFGCHLLKYRISTDTWTYGTRMDVGHDQEPMEEPLIHRRPDGALVAYYRLSSVGYMFSNVSHDNGETWSNAMQTKLWGYPFAALTVNGRDVLLAYGYRREPFGIRMALLAGGDVQAFDPNNEVVVRDDGASDDLGYPTFCVISDQEALLAYYYASKEDWDPTRYIAVQQITLNGGWTIGS